ncbi:LRP4-like protein, partial [Mya arenaria]
MGFASFVVLAIVAEVCSGNHGYYPSKMSFGKAGYYQYPTAYHGSTAACVGQFYCKNTQSSSGISWMQPSSQPECVNKMKICDGMMDCSNGADEKGCPAECKCGERSYLCMGKGKCINIKQVCDGDNDCPMNEDETCRSGCQCKQGEYQCDGGTVCIQNEQFCEEGGELLDQQCPNGDDEDDII